MLVGAWAFIEGALGSDISPRTLIGLLCGGAVIMIGGLLDDRYTLRARYQLWFPIIAAGIMTATGIAPETFTNPFGGTISLAPIAAMFVTFFWLIGMMFTTKFLDGLDGLVTGVLAIGALVIFFLSLHGGVISRKWRCSRSFMSAPASGFSSQTGIRRIFSRRRRESPRRLRWRARCFRRVNHNDISRDGDPDGDVLRVIVRRFQKNKPIFMGTRHLHLSSSIQDSRT